MLTTLSTKPSIPPSVPTKNNHSLITESTKKPNPTTTKPSKTNLNTQKMTTSTNMISTISNQIMTALNYFLNYFTSLFKNGYK
jgi:hypothetical protein